MIDEYSASIETFFENTSVILVDMQRGSGFLDDIPSATANSLLKNHKKFLELCSLYDVPVAVTEHVSGTKTVDELVFSLNGIIRVDYFSKKTMDGFENPQLYKALQSWKTQKALVIGVKAYGCVLETSITALNKGINVFSARNLIADSYQNDIALAVFSASGIILAKDYNEFFR